MTKKETLAKRYNAMMNDSKKYANKISNKLGKELITDIDMVRDYASNIIPLFNEDTITGDGVFNTSDYSLFRYMIGNRNVNWNTVDNIVTSMVNYGKYPFPIIVNEFFEIADGQHRFESIKLLGLDVDFIVIKGLNVEDCKILNSCGHNWKGPDFVHSYAARGYEDYQRLEVFSEECLANYGIHMGPLVGIIEGEVEYKNAFPTAIRNGSYKFTEERLEELIPALDFLKEFDYRITNKSLDGEPRMKQKMFAWLYLCDECDNTILAKILRDDNAIKHIHVSNVVENAFMTFSEVYNKFAKTDEYISFGRIYNKSIINKRKKNK